MEHHLCVCNLIPGLESVFGDFVAVLFPSHENISPQKESVYRLTDAPWTVMTDRSSWRVDRSDGRLETGSEWFLFLTIC